MASYKQVVHIRGFYQRIYVIRMLDKLPNLGNHILNN